MLSVKEIRFYIWSNDVLLGESITRNERGEMADFGIWAEKKSVRHRQAAIQQKWFILHCYSPLSYLSVFLCIWSLWILCSGSAADVQKYKVFSLLYVVLWACVLFYTNTLFHTHTSAVIQPTIHMDRLPVCCRPTNMSTITPPVAIQRIQITCLMLPTCLPCLQDSNPGASCCETLSHWATLLP